MGLFSTGKHDLRESALEKSIQALHNALVKISSGNLDSEIKEESFFRSNYAGSADRCSKVGELIDQCINELNAITATPLKRLSFTGGNNFHEGYLMGEQISSHIKDGESLLIIIPYFSQILHALRSKGTISYLQQNRTAVKILPIAMGKGNAKYTLELAKDLVEKHKDIGAIYTTDGVTTYDIEAWLREKRLDDKISLFTHNLSEENVSMLRHKSLKCILAENFYAQAYNAVIQLYNALETGWRPVSYKIYMDPLVINRGNFATFWDSDKKEAILSETEQAVLVQPEEHTSGKPWKIDVIMPTIVSFFTMAAKGAFDARDKLNSMGIEVNVIEAFESWENFASKQTMGPFIEKAVAEKADGIATTVFDRNLVPVINKAVEAGKAVTIFNSEPLNLREIILNVSDNINILQTNSTSIAASAEESARANEMVVKGMNNIEQSTSTQNIELTNAENSFNSLNDEIQNISRILNSYTESVEKMNSEAEKGVTQVSDSMESFKNLGDSFKKTDDQLKNLSTEMNRIRKIISTIESFSTDTNVLAINASIQAARAGEQGKSFAVVAKEIRSLSEKSAQATDEISRIIDVILSGVSGVVKHSAENLKLVEINSNRFSAVNDAFNVISNYLKENIDSVREIHQAIKNTVGSSSTIKETINSISSGNNETLQSVTEISMALRELSTQSAELADMADKYLELAKTQEKVIKQLSF